jgi:hypothetical protein
MQKSSGPSSHRVRTCSSLSCQTPCSYRFWSFVKRPNMHRLRNFPWY